MPKSESMSIRLDKCQLYVLLRGKVRVERVSGATTDRRSKSFIQINELNQSTEGFVINPVTGQLTGRSGGFEDSDNTLA